MILLLEARVAEKDALQARVAAENERQRALATLTVLEAAVDSAKLGYFYRDWDTDRKSAG